MKASHLLVRKIKRFEGFRKKAYQDVKGVWTIGYGHTGDVKEGDYITKQQAEELLLKDLERFERFVDSLEVCHGDQGKFDALTDFAYNCGIENLKKSTLLLYICEGRSEAEIRHEFSRWVYSGGRKLRGLAKRRQWEADRFFNSNTRDNICTMVSRTIMNLLDFQDGLILKVEKRGKQEYRLC